MDLVVFGGVQSIVGFFCAALGYSGSIERQIFSLQ